MERIRARAVVTAGLAGILFGFDTAVIAGATDAMRHVFGLSPAGLGAAVSAALWGTLVGALAFGSPGDRYGSRNMLRLIGAMYVISAIGCALSPGLGLFVAFRFIGGLAIGGSSVLAPVYISEIAPAQKRGMLVGMFQLNIVAGILIAYLSNFALEQIVEGPEAWRWKLGVAAAPAILFLLMMLSVPHSPRWLLLRRRREEAETSLAWLGHADPRGTADEYERIREESRQASGARLSWRLHRIPILLAFTIGMFNQLSGINAILYYLNDIFAAAGFSRVSSDLQAVAIGATNLLFTILALGIIDRVGRKPLLMIGAIGTGLALAGVAIVFATGRDQWLLLWLLIAFIAFFAASQGAVIWVYIGEIFPTSVRARGQSVGSASHWVWNAIISQTFPIVAARTHALPFWFFAGFMLIQLVVVWRFFPETKRVELDRMGDLSS